MVERPEPAGGRPARAGLRCLARTQNRRRRPDDGRLPTNHGRHLSDRRGLGCRSKDCPPSNTNPSVDRVESHREVQLGDLQGVTMIREAFGGPILSGAAVDRNFAPVLGDEDVGMQRRDEFVGPALFAAVDSFRGRRHDLDDNAGGVAEVLLLGGGVAIDHDVRVVEPIVVPLVDVGLHVVDEREALLVAEMEVEVCKDVSSDEVVSRARPGHGDDLPGIILMPHLTEEFPGQVILRADPIDGAADGAHAEGP